MYGLASGRTCKKAHNFRPVVTTDAQVLWCEEELIRFRRYIANGRSCLVHAILASRRRSAPHTPEDSSSSPSCRYILFFAYRPLSLPTIATTRHDRHGESVRFPVCDGHSLRRKCELAVAPRHASATPITLLITRWNTSSSILSQKSLVEISSFVTLHLLHHCLPSRVPTIGVAAMRREAPA
jgi:hypothetical protein